MDTLLISAIRCVRPEQLPYLANLERVAHSWALQSAHVALVDYGSAPGPQELLVSLASRFGFILHRVDRVDRVAGWSRARALNVAIRHADEATVRWVLPVDGDCMLPPDYATRMTGLVRDRPKILAVSLVRRLQNPSDDYESALGMPGYVEQAGWSHGVFDLRWLLQTRGYDERMATWGAEDDDLNHRALNDGYRMVWLHGERIPQHLPHPRMQDWATDSIDRAAIHTNYEILMNETRGPGRRTSCDQEVWGQG